MTSTAHGERAGKRSRSARCPPAETGAKLVWLMKEAPADFAYDHLVQLLTAEWLIELTRSEVERLTGPAG